MIIPKSTHFIVIYGISLLIVSFIDNIVMSNFLYSIMERHSLPNLLAFILLVIVSISGQSLMFYRIRIKYSLFRTKITNSALTFQILPIISIGINVILFSYLIFQIVQQSAYDTVVFKSIIFSNYFFSLFNIGLLIHYLFSWIRRNSSIVMLVYFLAFSVFVINEIGSILILYFQLEYRAEKISFTSNPWDSISLKILSFTDFYKITSIISFSIAWVGTCLLMYHYSRKIGRWKFWLLVGLPLIYYIGNIDIIRSTIFNYTLTTSPHLLSVVQVVLGGAKQIGGFFFALAFITISTKINGKRLKYYLLICATGVMLLFTSNQISLVQVIPYPPFGLVTISLLSVSSFLILVGLHNLASSMAFDKTLLENARKIVKEKGSTFLYDIGSAQWQKEIDNSISAIMENGSNQMDGAFVPTSLTEDEVKNYIDDLSEELKKQRNQKSL